MKEFSRPAFLAASNIYEVNIRQYTAEGTINAFRAHLPRLQEMGVKILWLMPVFPIGAVKRKGALGSYYSIKDFESINPEFGTLQDFKELVNNIHELRMRVILDWVANHAAWDNKWTPTNPDFFTRDEQGGFLSPYDWTDVIQINHDNVQQQDAMINAMKFWITQYNIDGFRADLAHLTPLSFWIKARTQLQEIKKELIWLAETEEPFYHDAFDISFTWKWMHATEEYIKDKADLQSLFNVLDETTAQFRDELKMYFTSNHDENSWNGTEYEKYGIFAEALAVFSCTYLHTVPLVYSGQELPVKKRLAFFEKDAIDWHPPILQEFYKKLLQLRNDHPELFNGQQHFKLLHAAKPLIAYEINSGDKSLFVAINLTKQSIIKHVEISINGNYVNLFTERINHMATVIHLELQPGSFILLLKAQ